MAQNSTEITPRSGSVLDGTQHIGPALTVNTPVTINLNVDQLERYTFSANAGSTYALQVAGVTGQPVTVSVFSPNVSTITESDYYTSFTTSGTELVNLPNLPATGTYTVVVYPGWGGPSSSAQLTLLPGASGAMTVGGPWPTYASNVAGQNIYLSFNAATGDNLDFTLSNLSVTGGSAIVVNVYNPNGSNVLSLDCSVSSVNCRAGLWNLTAGTYTIILSPPSSNAVISVTPELTAEIGGPVLVVNTAVAFNLNVYQVERYTFSANAGNSYALQLSGVAGQPVTVSVFSPTVSTITENDYYATFTTSSSSQQLTLSDLPATGTYTVVIYPGWGGPSSSGQLTLVAQ